MRETVKGNVMHKYKAVLFDYDGTLIDTNGIIVNSWQFMGKTAAGIEFTVDDIIRTFGLSLEEAVEKVAKDYGIEGYTTDELCKLYRGYQAEHQEELGELYPGIKEVLFKLKEEGLLVGIVTSRSKESAEVGLRLNGVFECFDAIVGAGDTDIHKPLPEPCLICCKKLGVKPEEAIMIGDSRHDIACAANAGAASVFVKWSFCTKPEELTGISVPTYVIDKAEELLDIV